MNVITIKLLSLNKIRLASLILPFLFCVSDSLAQANYVNNGGFEEYWSCTFPNEIRKVKYWRSIDSSQVTALYFSSCPGISNVPSNSYSFQYPRHGDSYIGLVFYCLNGSCSPEYNRSYARNRLKDRLEAGKVYCVKFYVNLTTTSSYGVDGIAALFTDNISVDTITKSNLALTYFQPQISNQTANIVTDTLIWTVISGTFTATGNESNLVIGNFKSDANTNAVITNSNQLPFIESNYLIDDVSCIPLDLPAYAYSSNAAYAIPGNTLYLGRQRDVGIDEACMWYKLPNNTNAIDTAAGITITVAATTETYMVKQDICGMIKYDTVVVYPSAAGLISLSGAENGFNIFPNPANDEVEIQISNAEIRKGISSVIISNSLGQKVAEENFTQPEKIKIDVSSLEDGVYFVSVFILENQRVVKKLIVGR